MDLGIEISQGLTRNETRRRVTRRARASTRDVVPSVARASGAASLANYRYNGGHIV